MLDVPVQFLKIYSCPAEFITSKPNVVSECEAHLAEVFLEAEFANIKDMENILHVYCIV